MSPRIRRPRPAAPTPAQERRLREQLAAAERVQPAPALDKIRARTEKKWWKR